LKLLAPIIPCVGKMQYLPRLHFLNHDAADPIHVAYLFTFRQYLFVQIHSDLYITSGINDLRYPYSLILHHLIISKRLLSVMGGRKVKD